MSVFSRLRSHSSSSSSNKGSHPADPHTWEWPTRFSISGYEAPVIPKPEVFKNVFVTPGFNLAPLDPPGSEQIDQVSHPTSAHVAVHLCLLECFWGLKRDASEFSIVQSPAPPSYTEATEGTSCDVPEDASPDEKWHLLIQLAVERFRVWFENIEHMLRHASAYTNHTGRSEQVRISQNYLPPLDVLLIWYSYLSDPISYRADVNVLGKSFLLSLPFPWKAIFDVIDKETMTYNLPKPAAMLFHTLCKQDADILKYMSTPPAYTEQMRMPFSIDLVAAVKETEEYATKAHGELLIRSPSLERSIERAVSRCCQWVLLCRKYTNQVIMPPADIEIIIRTQRVSSSSYISLGYHLFGPGPSKAGRQDVKISPSYIDASRKLWEETYSEPYTTCKCWTCERIREYDSGWIHDSGRSPDLTKTQVRSIKDDIGFYRAVQLAREQGLPLPVRPPSKAERRKRKKGNEG